MVLSSTRLRDHEGSTFLYHEPCPKCGSKDNFGRFDDGHGYCFGFGCGHYEPRCMDQDQKEDQRGHRKGREDFLVGVVQAIPNRKLTDETCKLFDYQSSKLNGKTCHIANWRDSGGRVVAQKVRLPNKEFKWIGKNPGGLYGQWLWPEGGKKLTITEGEIDCLSVSQMFGNKWPVVSLPNGAQSVSKSIKQSYEWLTSFDEVILMLDQDEPGRGAAQEIAELLPLGKVKLAKLPMKDANECLVNGRGDDIVKAFWNAAPYRPDGIVGIKDIKESLFEPVVIGRPWPWQQFTDLTYGRKKKHLYAFGAGVGVGKTDVFTECISYDITELKQNVGVIYLEQPVEETVQRVAGKFKSKLFHVPDTGWTPEEYRAAVDELEAMDRLWLYQHFGSKDWDTVSKKIRYFNKALGVEHIYLDHLTALVATAEDERRALDRIMAEMAGLAHELDLIIHFISHLTTPTHGPPHEEGGRVYENQFTGSRAIARWAHYMIGLERNKQAEDEGARSTTTVRILKDRWTGRATGMTFPLHYDRDTGRLTESMF